MTVAEDSTALLGLENAARRQVDTSTQTFQSTTTRQLGAAQQPATGTEFLSQIGVDAILTAAFAVSQQRAQDIVSAAYTAGALLALTALTTQFRNLGHDVPQTLPYLGGNLGLLLADVGTAHGQAKLALHDLIRAGYDGVSGPGAPAARTKVIQGAVQRTTATLRNRLTASAVVAVHQGYTDAELAIYRQFELINPYIQIQKRWQVQSATPCVHCAALDGTTIDVAATFDGTATTDPAKRQVPVRGILSGPPRHPNCRCRLVTVVVTRKGTAAPESS